MILRNNCDPTRPRLKTQRGFCYYCMSAAVSWCNRRTPHLRPRTQPSVWCNPGRCSSLARSSITRALWRMHLHQAAVWAEPHFSWISFTFPWCIYICTEASSAGIIDAASLQMMSAYMFHRSSIFLIGWILSSSWKECWLCGENTTECPSPDTQTDFSNKIRSIKPSLMGQSKNIGPVYLII